MSPAPPPPPGTAVDRFARCHVGIVGGLRQFATLATLNEAGQRARAIATATLELFDQGVKLHHEEEELELFRAVLRSARPGPERDRVQALVAQLTAEHREVEALWRRLRPEVRKAAAGLEANLRADAIDLLQQVYTAHAHFEERDFLPLAEEILGRDGNHMAALGLALHMRGVPFPSSYI